MTGADGTPGGGFGTLTLPYGVVAPPGAGPRVGVAVDDLILDLAVLLGGPEFEAASLNRYMATGPGRWAEVRAAVRRRVAAGLDPAQADVHRACDAAAQGSLLELSQGGIRQVRVGSEARTFLEDGDRVVVRGFIGHDRMRPLGEAAGVIRGSAGRA